MRKTQSAIAAFEDGKGLQAEDCGLLTKLKEVRNIFFPIASRRSAAKPAPSI